MPTPRPHGSRRRRRTTTSTQAGKCRPARPFRTERTRAIPNRTSGGATCTYTKTNRNATAVRSRPCGSCPEGQRRVWRHVLNSLSSAIIEAVPPHVRGGSYMAAGGSSGTVARSRPRVRPSAELGSVGAHRERSAGCASSSSSAEAPPRPTPTLSSRSRSARAFHTAGRARAVCTWSTLGVLVVVALEDLHRQAGPSTRAASAVRALAAARSSPKRELASSVKPPKRHERRAKQQPAVDYKGELEGPTRPPDHSFPRNLKVGPFRSTHPQNVPTFTLLEKKWSGTELHLFQNGLSAVTSLCTWARAQAAARAPRRRRRDARYCRPQRERGVWWRRRARECGARLGRPL